MKYFIVVSFIAISALSVQAYEPVPPVVLPIATPKPQKLIDVDLSEQKLRYYFGDILVGDILISSGLPRTPTPIGEFTIDKKAPVIRYSGWNTNGTRYDLPNTKWNLRFFPRYWIHGAYWHNNFGNPMSHGCVNVSYKEMERLYIFADVGTKVVIHQ